MRIASSGKSVDGTYTGNESDILTINGAVCFNKKMLQVA